MHQKTLKATQRYLAGKEATPTLFDDAQFHVFKELLFYWAGYRRATSTPEDPKKKPGRSSPTQPTLQCFHLLFLLIDNIRITAHAAAIGIVDFSPIVF